jgi:hypothetical protein
MAGHVVLIRRTKINKMLRSSLFGDVTQRLMVVTDVL